MRICLAWTVPRMIRRSTKARRDVPRGRRRRAMRRLVVTTRCQSPATENRQTRFLVDEERKPRELTVRSAGFLERERPRFRTLLTANTAFVATYIIYDFADDSDNKQVFQSSQLRQTSHMGPARRCGPLKISVQPRRRRFCDFPSHPNEAPRAARATRTRVAMGSGAGPNRGGCLLYTSPSPRDVEESRMPSSA